MKTNHLSKTLRGICRVDALVRSFACATSLLLCLSGAAWADGGRLAIDQLRQGRSGEIEARLTLRDVDGGIISGASASDFNLLVDGVEQGPGSGLRLFPKLQEPVYVVAVVQTSASMESALPDVKRGLVRLRESVAAVTAGRLGLLAYGAEVERLLDMGPPAELERALAKLAVNNDSTEVRLRDALHTGIDMLRAQGSGRKVLLVFSDGIDIQPERRLLAEVAQRAEQASIVIDPIGYAPFEASGVRNLGDLAKRTGGVLRACRNPGEISRQFGMVGEEILNQYVVNFSIPPDLSDSTHALQVLRTAGRRPLYSQTVSMRLAPPLKDPPAERTINRLWGLLLLLGGVGLAGWLLRRRVWRLLCRAWTRLRGRPAVATMKTMIRSGAEASSVGATLFVPEPGEVVTAWLLRLNGPRRHETCKLATRTVVGKAPDCHVVVEDEQVSAYHCELRMTDGGYKLADLGSTNGLVVNGRVVRNHVLVDQDLVRVGRSEFRYRSIAL